MAGYLGNIPTPQATQTRDTFTATSGQTSFATSGYTVGMLDVYLNGIKLASADFTASNGSDVVLASGASTGDIVEVVSFSTFESDSGTFTGAVTVGGDLTVDTSTLKVDSSNNRVGIGTASPSALTTIKTASNEEDAILIEQSDGTDIGSISVHGGAFKFQGKSATAPVQLQTHDGNEDIEVDPDGFIKMETAGAERLRIDSSGTTSFHGLDGRCTTSTGHLSISDQSNNRSYLETGTTSTGSMNLMVFVNPNGVLGAVNVNSSTCAFNNLSDYRAKENVTYSWDATSRLKQLKPARFNFKADKDTTMDGFLAHEVSVAVPIAVTGEKDAVEVWEKEEKLPDGVSVGDNKLDEDGDTIPVMQAIDHSKLVPLLVKTIQELEARITALEAK